MLIYLASPYGHHDPLVMEERYQAVLRKAGRLLLEGHLIFSPIAHSHPIAITNKIKGWDLWGKLDLEILARCDELWVLKLDGWSTSNGIAREIEAAISLGKPIKYLEPSA